jgi:2',3'-cyclic-nucleotide 2'-phosphodiesterase (5'-nucleotidase family)
LVFLNFVVSCLWRVTIVNVLHSGLTDIPPLGVDTSHNAHAPMRSFLVVLVLFMTVSWAQPPVTLLVVSKFQAELSNFPALYTALTTARTTDPNTITVAHGDSFGATSSASKLLREQPGVLAMNELGIQVDALGNQNFNPGLSDFQSLLPNIRATICLANLGTCVMVDIDVLY